jgi:hypothetical protein
MCWVSAYIGDKNVSKKSPFYALRDVFIQAEAHARSKGVERHALTPDQPFDKQPICEIARQLGLGAPLGQAMKKILESQQLARFPGRAKAELLGAINYIAAAVIVLEEQAVIASKKEFKGCPSK